MAKEDLILAVRDKLGISRQEAADSFDATTEAIMAALLEDPKHTLRVVGFGTLTAKTTPSRMGRNPQTGEAIKIPAGVRVLFSPSTTFKERLMKTLHAKPRRSSAHARVANEPQAVR